MMKRQERVTRTITFVREQCMFICVFILYLNRGERQRDRERERETFLLINFSQIRTLEEANALLSFIATGLILSLPASKWQPP